MSTKVLRLDKEHTHNAVKYPIGATLPPLDARVADWLIGMKVGHEEGTQAGESTITRTTAAPARRASCCGGRW